MSSRRSPRQLLVTLLLGVLIGGGLMAITPAGAEVSQAAATSWKKIWKKNLKPLADKRYYTKKQSDTTYATKTESAATSGAAAAAAKAASEAAAAAAAANSSTDTKLGNYYTKEQGDAKYAPYPSLITGTYYMTTTADGFGDQVGTEISFGYTLPVAPTEHYIKRGAPVPVGCSGTFEAPNAASGHLCLFERAIDTATNQQIYDVTGSPGSSRMGALLNALSTGPGIVNVAGSWAVRPASVS